MDGTANLRKEHPGRKVGQPGQGKVLLWAMLANESHLYPILLFCSLFFLSNVYLPNPVFYRVQTLFLTRDFVLFIKLKMRKSPFSYS